MTYPVTIEEFKSFFIRESGIMYQSYQEWEPHGYPSDIYVWVTEEGGGVFLSKADYNCTMPTNSPDKWQQIIGPGDESVFYNKGDFVYDKLYGRHLGFYVATEDKASVSDPKVWLLVSEHEVQETLKIEFEPWVQPDGYQRGDLILYYMNYKPYVFKCIVAITGEPPTVPVSGAKAIAYGDWEIDEEETEQLNDEILDADILRAMSEASFKFNENLFTEEKGKLVFLYLTMFFLVYDKQMAASGINGNSAAGPVLSRTVGKMSVSYMESKLFKNYPSYEFLSTNDYGRKAFNLMMPYLRGNVRILKGGSTGE